MKSSFVATLLGITILGCGGKSPETAPTPATVATAPMLDSLWNEALSQLAAEEWREAGTLLERLLLELPRRDPRLPEARLALGKARLGQDSYLQAVREFRRVADDHATDSLAPLGLLRAGDAYAKLWRRPELDPTYGGQAVATWQELLSRYPDSIYADSARARIAGLNEWYAIKQFKAAEFYIGYKAYEAAIIYLKDLVAKYPTTEIAPKAMTELVAAYRELGYVEDINEMCRFFRLNYPDAADLEESCPAVTVPAAPPDSVTGR